jgi:hypothetical protein
MNQILLPKRKVEKERNYKITYKICDFPEINLSINRSNNPV